MSSPGPGASDAVVLATQAIEAIEAAALELGVDLPTDRYITTGAAVHDCPQVVVTITQLRTGLPPSGNLPTGGLPGPAANGSMWCAPPWHAVLQVEIVRDCAPTPNGRGVIPKAKLTAAAAIPAADADVIIKALDNLKTYVWANMDATIAMPPMTGGFVATTATVTAVLGGR